MASKKTDLSVIVLSFNTKDITDHCLTCLKKAVENAQNAGKELEVIVVENASGDGSLEMIQKKHIWVDDLIVSKVNTGFSGGNNLAMKQAKGDLFLLLNSDAYVEKDTLVKTLDFFSSHPQCDVLGCKLHFEGGRFQPSAGYLPTPLNTFFWISGFDAFFRFLNPLTHPIHPKSKEFYQNEREVEWVMGAFLALKKEVFEKTGGFDETIFMYGEEVEWCRRIRDKGFKMFYTPGFEITHLDKASSGFMIQKPLLNEVKGIVRYFHQHYRKEYPWIKILIFLSLIYRIFVYTLVWKPQRIRAYTEALKVI